MRKTVEELRGHRDTPVVIVDSLGLVRFVNAADRPLRLPIAMKDGREVDAEHTIIAERCDGAWMFAATIVPPAERAER
jgi:hypothetical protein